MYSYIIIIPYRNRAAHLDIFIQNTVPILAKYLVSFKVVVVEQDDGKMFNRGALLNIGYLESKKSAEQSQIIWFNHDVDVYPSDKAVSTLYIHKPIKLHHDSITCETPIETPSEKSMETLDAQTIQSGITGFVGIYTPPCDTLGTIIKFSGEAFAACNGYPNIFWGWGVEDKALQNRAETFNLPITKHLYHNSSNRNEYFTVKDDIADRVQDRFFHSKTAFEYDIFKHIPTNQKILHIDSSGLNNIEYKVLARTTIHPNVDIIKVSI